MREVCRMHLRHINNNIFNKLLCTIVGSVLFLPLTSSCKSGLLYKEHRKESMKVYFDRFVTKYHTSTIVSSQNNNERLGSVPSHLCHKLLADYKRHYDSVEVLQLSS